MMNEALTGKQLGRGPISARMMGLGATLMGLGAQEAREAPRAAMAGPRPSAATMRPTVVLPRSGPHAGTGGRSVAVWQPRAPDPRPHARALPPPPLPWFHVALGLLTMAAVVLLGVSIATL